MLCIIAREIDGVNALFTMQAAELEFGTKRFCAIMNGLDSYYAGYMVTDLEAKEYEEVG